MTKGRGFPVLFKRQVIMSTEQITLHIEDLVIETQFYYDPEDLSVGCPADVSDIKLNINFDDQTEEMQEYIIQEIHRIASGGI